ncbi:hypothetical protein F8S13_11650 [Chloroflexia bacterium SDU3-3]|nr:hypothetical protein F8S13_11650 [Chloroflexia bacterium SDU3-3]
MKADQENISTNECKSILSTYTTSRTTKSIHTLTEDEMKKLEERNKGLPRLMLIMKTIEELIVLEKQNGGNLRGTGARKAAAEKLNVSVWTIDNYIKRYKENPSIDAFIDKKRGRNIGDTFTLEQQQVISWFYLNRQKYIITSDNEKIILEGLEDTIYIKSVLDILLPLPYHSYASIRRFIRILDKDKALMSEFARHGERHVASKILPARRNDAAYVNERWQIDARPLPIYIIHDGIKCTVTLLLIIDDLSQYPIRARLIPRKIRDEEGIPRKSDFTAADVGILLASAIYYSGICPSVLYNDHGSQLIAMEDFLGDMSEQNLAVIRMAKSIPRRPRGRGKIENMLKRFDELICNIYGNTLKVTGKESLFDLVERGHDALVHISLEDFQIRCDEFIKFLREEPRRRGEKQTRAELWSASENIQKAPPIRDLMRLVPNRITRDTAIDYWKFQLANEEYEPRLKSEEDLYQWAVASARKEKVPLRAAELDQGWECDICLDREANYWAEGILKTTRYLSQQDFPPMLSRVLKRMNDEHSDFVEGAKIAVQKISNGQVFKHQITRQPIIVNTLSSNMEMLPATDDKPESAVEHTSNTSVIPQPKVAPSNVSIRKAPERKGPEPAKRKFDWSRAPKAQETLKRIEGELHQEQE